MNKLKFWIALNETHGIGPAHLLEIYNKVNDIQLSIEDIFDLTKDELINEFNFSSKLSEEILSAKETMGKIESHYFDLIDRGIEIIPFFSKDYPSRLKEKLHKGFPPLLYIYGNKDILSEKGIAILGDKDISEKGKSIAYFGAKELSRHKIVVISGFAAGADMTAHISALENYGSTLAILPCGINHLKVPDSLKHLLNPEKILFVSPFFPTKEADKFNAFIRNKIISALSCSLFIVEAPDHGGVFEAAKSANKLSVPLFTAQYSEYPENAQGNEKILKEMNAFPVKGRMENDNLIPNMDKMIGILKYGI